MGISLLDLPAGLNIQDIPPGPTHGLYVHVPFCFHKCHYCDFYSITRQTPERMHDFVDRLLIEANMWSGRTTPIETIFFGGGTPSLLPEKEMSRLLKGLHQRFDLSGLKEFTIECNPATVDQPYLASLREHGVDRLSFGAQSFNPADLKMLERHHDPEDVPRSLEAARAAELAYLRIRTTEGINFKAFTIATGADATTLFSDAIAKLLPLGLIESDPTGLRLTEKGVPLSDAVASEFL